LGLNLCYWVIFIVIFILKELSRNLRINHREVRIATSNSIISISKFSLAFYHIDFTYGTHSLKFYLKKDQKLYIPSWCNFFFHTYGIYSLISYIIKSQLKLKRISNSPFTKKLNVFTRVQIRVLIVWLNFIEIWYFVQKKSLLNINSINWAQNDLGWSGGL
jgi:hypothetical protein